MELEGFGRRQRDGGATGLFSLLGYFVYFRNRVEGNAGVHGVASFPVPKPLLMLLLRPLGRAAWPFACSAVVSAALGSVVYLLSASGE